MFSHPFAMLRTPVTFLLILIGLVLTSACRSTAAPTAAATPTPQPPTATQPPATATQAPSPSPTPAPLSIPGYAFSVDLDYDRHIATVNETIRYANRTTETLTELHLLVPPDQYSGVFTLDAITWGDGQAVVGAGWQENHVLAISLPQPLAAGDSLEIKLDYHLALPSPAAVAGSRPVPFGYKDRQTNLVDWYPFIPPYLNGQGWLVHPDSYYGEYLVFETADFSVDLRLSSARPLIVAASSPEEPGSTESEKHYRLQNVRNFAISASPDYVVTHTQAAGLDVISYAFPLHANAGQAAGEVTAEAINVFSQRFGPLPRVQLSVVEADFLDGMEYDGLYFLSDGFYNLFQGQPAEYLTAIAAHETAHQWWYASVGNDQALEPWLDESLSTYSERLYYEQVHPEALEWWWAARINYFQPAGWVDSSIYDHVGQANAYEQYRNAVYLNGAVFLEDLRQSIGDEAFFAFIKDYAQSNAGKIATKADFFAALYRHTDQGHSALLQKYFKSP